MHVDDFTYSAQCLKIVRKSPFWAFWQNKTFWGFSTTLYEPNKSKTMSFFIKILIEYLYQNQLLRYMTEMID